LLLKVGLEVISCKDARILPWLIIPDLSPLPEIFTYQPLDTVCSPNVPEHSTEASVLLPDCARVNELGANISANFTLIRPISSRIVDECRPFVLLESSTTRPFMWAVKIDWSSLTKAMGSNSQMVQTWRPDLSQLNAILYSQYQITLTTITAPESIVFQHLVSSIINGVNYYETKEQSEVYHQLTALPRQAVSAFFKALPTEIVDIIRQRLRVAAVKTHDPETVEALLELERGLCVSALRTDAEVSFILDRLKTCGHTVALVLVRYASRTSRSQYFVLSQIVSMFTDCGYRDDSRPKLVALIQILVEAGATLTQSCFFLEWHNSETLEELIDLGEKDIFAWIQEGLLTTAVSRDKSSYSHDRFIAWILSALKRSFHQRSALSMRIEHDATVAYSALLRAFQAALRKAWDWAIEAIYDTCLQLGYTAYYSQVDSHLNTTVIQACSDRDWGRAHQAVSNANPAGASQSSFNVHFWKEFRTQEEQAVLVEDFQTIKELLNQYEDQHTILQVAIEFNCDSVAALTATYCGNNGIIDLLENCKVRAINVLLCRHSHWTEFLQDTSLKSNYDELEDILYRKEPHESCRRFPCCLSFSPLVTQQIALRVLSYYAIYQSDVRLLDWLWNHGLATENILFMDAEDKDMVEIRTISCQKGKLLNSDSANKYSRRLPSLLEVASQRDDTNILTYLLCRRPTYRDSNALLYAIKAKAQIATIELLLQGDSYGSAASNAQHGSAALRVAIRDKNYELVRILAQATDIHGLETVSDEDGCLNYLDPLGEAILGSDCTVVKILLENGGDPNTIVAFDGLQEHAPRTARNSVLSRMTALLVAIDVGNNKMVQLLVENGADINRQSTMGLLRTPLQRASEIGDFELSQYFIAQGAVIDAAPVHGGGTALQLAAMSGHLGIATLLIQQGADINHPPARGPGRTAFEAAAEWCRPDMMHLLVQYGAQLDLEVEEEIEESFERDGMADSEVDVFLVWRTVRKSRTQYERALQFTEDRKEYASKRIVESLGRQIRVT
jgi:hypothetical protein